MQEAMLYERLEDGRVQCKLCAHRCQVAEGARGICQVRENHNGALYSLVYGQLIARALDPIEKKPLFHFYPGSTTLSVATVGCNFRCSFCQNADISQMPRDDKHIDGHATAPEAIIQAAQRYRGSGCRSISYTYTEPTIFFEYAYAISQLAHQAGLANTWVTNGYMTLEMLDLVAPRGSSHQPPGPDHPEPASSDPQPLLMDAANVDLKAFTDTFYRQQCGARLQPVLDSLIELKRRGVWVEVTTLVIPGLNDSPQELADIARFIATQLGAETPWHVSRFHPTYHLTDRPLTPVSSVRRARDSGLAAGLRYVYEGNVPGSDGEDTCCPACQRAIIRRMGFTVLENHVRGGACDYCGGPVDGVWP